MRKQSSGLYRTKLKIGVDESGKPIYKWLSSPTQRGLEEEKRKARALYIDGTGLEEDRLFGAYASEWFRVRKEPHIAPGTRKLYRTILNKYLLPEFGDYNLRAVRPMDIQRYVNGMAGKSGTQIHTIIAALRGVFGSALQDRLIAFDPTTGIVRPDAAPVKEKRALTPEERQSVEEAIQTASDGILLGLLYYLGVRSGEARGLKWGDVDWVKGRVHVERDVDPANHDEEGELKTPGSDRWIPIPAPLMALLKAQRGTPGAYIVPGTRPGKPMSQATCVTRWAAIREAAGLPEEMTPHWLRHNFITMCRDAGLRAEDTMYLAGHTSYATTLKVYTHVTEAHLSDLDAQAPTIFASFESCKKVAQAPQKGE